jgi:hypothetical protein
MAFAIFHPTVWVFPPNEYWGMHYDPATLKENSIWFSLQNWPWDLIVYRQNYELINFPSVGGASSQSSAGGPSAAAWIS